MSLPATANFTGTDGTQIVGTTTDTGGFTWAGSTAVQINSNFAYGNAVGGSGGGIFFDAATGDVIVQAKLTLNGSGFPALILRASNAPSSGLPTTCVRVNVTNGAGTGAIHLYNAASSDLVTPATGLTIADGDVIRAEVSGNVFTIKVNGTTRLTGTTSHGAGNTIIGLFFAANSDEWDTFSADVFAVSSPTATLTKANLTTAYLAGTPGTGGTSPQWSRSTAPDLGFSNLSNGGGVSGATSDNLVDGSVTPGTHYFYKVTYATSGASNVQSGGTWKRPAYVMFLGDSITTGFGGTTDPVAQFALAVKNAANGQRDVVVSNQGQSGTLASDWYDSTGSGAQARLVTASGNGLTAGCTHAMVTFGINDAFGGHTATRYQNDLSGIATYLLGQGYTAVILNYPTGFRYDGTGALPLMLTYAAKIDLLVNGTTVLQGDQEGLWYFQDRAATELQTSGAAVHPTDAGYRSLGEMWAWAWARAVGDAGGGSGGVSLSRFAGGPL